MTKGTFRKEEIATPNFVCSFFCFLFVEYCLVTEEFLNTCV